MRLELLGGQIVNFKSVQGPLTLNLAERGPGLHFIRGINKRGRVRIGSNGAGKTSLWDAFCWCWYGQTPDKLRAPDIKPWYGDTETKVATIIRIGKKKHTIERRTHPNSLTIDNKPATDADVERLLGLSFDIFTNAVLLGQGRPLFFDLTPAKKMEIFSASLSLDRWDRYSQRAKDKVGKLDEKADEYARSLSEWDGELKQLEAQIERGKIASEEWEARWREKADDAEGDKKKLKASLDKLELRKNDAELALDGALMELRPLEKQIRDLMDERGISKQAYEKRLTLHSIKINTLDDAIKTHRTNCPTCGQKIKSEHKGDLEKKLKLAIQAYHAELEPKEIAKLTAKIERLTKDSERFQTKSDDAQASLNNLLPLIGEHRQAIKSIDERTKEREEEANPYTAQIREGQKQRKAGLAAVAELEKKIAINRRVAERALFWVKGFKDVRLYIVDEVLQELELVTNAMLEEVGLVDWQVQYSIEKETKSGTITRGLNVTILSPDNDKPVKWECWSGGEGQRLRIIGALALSEVLLNQAGMETGFEILDEPVHYLSPEGVRDVCDYLADRADRLQSQIFYIDHQSVDSTRFASVLTMIKDETGTRLK